MVDPAQASSTNTSVVVPPQDLPALGSMDRSQFETTHELSSGASPSLPTPLATFPSPLTTTLDASASPSTTSTLQAEADSLDELRGQGLIELTEGGDVPSISSSPTPTSSPSPPPPSLSPSPPPLPSPPSTPPPSPSTVPPSSPSSTPPPTPPPTPKASEAPSSTLDSPLPERSVLDVLLNQNSLTQDEATKINAESLAKGATVDSLLDSWPGLKKDELAKARAKFYKVAFINLAEIGVSPEALLKVPENIARHYQLLPFAFNPDDNLLSVAMSSPLDVTAIDFLQQKTGARILPHYADPDEIMRFVNEQYAQNISGDVDRALQQTEKAAPTRKDFAELTGDDTIRQAPIAKIVQTILSLSLKYRASDIHIEPQEHKTRVRYRIDGILQERLILPQSVHNSVVSRIKILSGLKIDERRIPQDGRFNFADGGKEVDLRVSTLPTIHGEKVVMRLLRKNNQVPSLAELGLRDLALRYVEDSIKVPHGIILVTGPTGSGKTTTLYSVLHSINTPRVNIMTLEDPVEYMMSGVNQVQINPQAGLTFSSGLRSFLRQDPNVIMVGEIRDNETAALAIQASLTGHLVFSTLHTSSAATALPRLMDMEAEPFLLASSMTCIIAQRIARVINPEYKEAYKPEPAVLEDIKEVLGEHFNRWLAQKGISESEVMLHRPSKERPQTEAEYLGRVAIFEVIKINEEISKLILKRESAQEIEKVAVREGMLLMKQDGYIKTLEGLTTIEEVLRVAEI